MSRVAFTFGILALVGCFDFDALDRCHGGKCANETALPDASAASCIQGLAAGWGHTCARTSSSTLSCWGLNNAQQISPALERGSVEAVPVQVRGSGVAGVATGDSFTCTVGTNGKTSCWGYNFNWQLGTSEKTAGPVDVPDAVDSVFVAAGLSHACTVDANHRLLCWGANEHGQLGAGDTASKVLPVRVAFDGVASVAVGESHTCARSTNGELRCWGSNAYGQIGDGGDAGDRTAPTGVVLDDVVELAAGLHHTCAVRRDETVWCWGLNNLGQLGVGTNDSRPKPTRVANLTGIRRVAIGGYSANGPYAHTCALTRAGEVYCWGSNASGELGDGTRESSPMPRRVQRLSDATDIAVGAMHTCAARPTSVTCWGSGDEGRLGDGESTTSSAPVETLMTCQ